MKDKCPYCGNELQASDWPFAGASGSCINCWDSGIVPGSPGYQEPGCGACIDENGEEFIDLSSVAQACGVCGCDVGESRTCPGCNANI